MQNRCMNNMVAAKCRTQTQCRRNSHNRQFPCTRQNSLPLVGAAIGGLYDQTGTTAHNPLTHLGETTDNLPGPPCKPCDIHHAPQKTILHKMGQVRGNNNPSPRRASKYAACACCF